MKVSIVFESTLNEDGYDETLLLQREGVEDFYDMMEFYRQASRAVGFDYVDRIGYADSKGVVKWGKF